MYSPSILPPLLVQNEHLKRESYLNERVLPGQYHLYFVGPAAQRPHWGVHYTP